MTESDVRPYLISGLSVSSACTWFALVCCNARLPMCTPSTSTCLQTKDVEVNFEQMFLNTVEGLEAGGANLQHVQFVSGEACCLYDELYKTCTAMMALIAAPLLSKRASLCNFCRYQMVRCMLRRHDYVPLIDAFRFGQVSHD